MSHIYLTNSLRRSVSGTKDNDHQGTGPKLYDLNKEAITQHDTSEKGCNVTLLHKGQLVAFISCSCSKAEQNYVQTEKKCLSFVYAYECFNQ